MCLGYFTYTRSYHVHLMLRKARNGSFFLKEMYRRLVPLGTIKASQVVVLNEDSVVVTQLKVMLTA